MRRGITEILKSHRNKKIKETKNVKDIKEKRLRRKKARRILRIIRWTGFPLLFLWLQIIFRVSTVGGVTFPFMGFCVLFSIAYGLVLEFIISFITNRTTYTVVKAIMIFISALLIEVWYLIFCKFGAPYYDWNTATAGAGDAITEFYGDIIALICCFNGILHIILIFAPIALYLLDFRKMEKVIPVQKWPERVIGIVAAVVIYVIAFLFIRLNPATWDIYDESYNITSTVDRFGFYTGPRLEIKHLIFPKKENFTGLPSENPEIVDDDASKYDAKKYDFNMLDIDFEELANTTTNKNLAAIDQYVAGLTPSYQNDYTGLFEGKNLIFITAEAFTKQVIDPELTPTLYRLATKGFQFTDYYQPSSAGTTGGEYSNIFGMLPTSGGSSFKNTATHLNYMTMGYQLNKLGYWGKAYHNNSYTFYDRNKTHINLGYSEGFMGWGNGMEKYIEQKTWPESDKEMMEGTLTEYIDQEHFNVYYMSVSGHSVYGFNNNAMSKRYKDLVEDLPGSELVKAYKACNMDLDRGLEAILTALEEKGKLDDTVIVISPDHYPYGLDDGENAVDKPYLKELYGVNSIPNNWVQDQNSLIIWSGCLETNPELAVEISSPTSSLDILPTLLNLFGVEYDSRLCVGRDVFSSNQDALTFNTGYDWKTDYGTYIGANNSFTPVDSNQTYPCGLRGNTLVTSGVTESEYVDYIKALVKNKNNFCKNVLDNDYWRHVFPNG